MDLRNVFLSDKIFTSMSNLITVTTAYYRRR